MSPRACEGTSNYLYDGSDLIEEVDGQSGLTAKYIEGIHVDEPLAITRSQGTRLYQQDDLGSVTSLTDPSGSITDTYTFGEFGDSQASTGAAINPFRYTAREFDRETGLYFYRARYYDSELGRFTSEDPIGFDGGYEFYGYVENDPVNSIDPSGLRDIVVAVWNRKGGSVGHVGAFELDGSVILSQFPKQCRCIIASNSTKTWPETLADEGRRPDHVFRIHVPNDAGFDSVAAKHRKRPTWDWDPTIIDFDETNCVYSVEKALRAGGVPVGTYDWPGNLGDDLTGKAGTTNQPWKVTPLPDVPWNPKK